MQFSFKEIVATEDCPASKDIETFVFEPESGEEKLGSLMVLTEIAGENEDKEASSWLSNLVAYKAKNSFFNIGVHDTEEGIQKACRSLNEKLKRLKQEGELSWTDSFNVLIAALSPEGSLFISRIGAGGAFITQEEKMANIDSQLPAPKDNYFFEQLGEAKLSSENSLLLFSSNLASLSQKQQKKYLKIILDFPPQKAKEKFQEKKLGCFAVLVCELGAKKKKISLDWKLPIKGVLKGGKKILLTIKNVFQEFVSFLSRSLKKASLFFKRKSEKKEGRGQSIKDKLSLPPFLKGRNAKRVVLIVGLVLVLIWVGFLGRQRLSRKKEQVPEPEEKLELPAGVEVLTDLDATTSPSFSVRFLLSSDTDLWAVGSTSLYSLTASKQVYFKKGINYDFASKIYGYKKDEFYFFSPPNLLTTFDLSSGTSSTKEINIPAAIEAVHSLGYFRENLYLLGSAYNQVVKYPDMNFSSPRYWLSEEASKNLEEPVSFTIDGSIYILDSKIGLGEYRVGKKIDEYSLASSTLFSLSSDTRIYTREGFSNVYLYLPEGNLKVYGKEEKELREELEVPAQARDFVVRKDEVFGYLLGPENKVYRVDLK